MIPLKYKGWVLSKQLPIDTDLEPSEVTGKNCTARFIEVSDKKIIIDVSSFRGTPLVYFFLCILAAKMFYDEASGETLFIIIGLFISTVSVLLSFFALAWFVLFRKKQVIFDREKGTVSIPGPFWYKNVEIPFNDVVAITRKENRYYGIAKVLNLYRPDGYKVGVGINGYDIDSLKRDWAFYVWYMDKSRPLPPSPIFNKYRGNSYTSVVANTA